MATSTPISCFDDQDLPAAIFSDGVIVEKVLDPCRIAHRPRAHRPSGQAHDGALVRSSVEQHQRNVTIASLTMVQYITCLRIRRMRDFFMFHKGRDGVHRLRRISMLISLKTTAEV
ncbi:hypothetical protein F5Y05DRAFT_49106 [Hypoxylon sp. FL0543]|nr:hypothetical protein F5Y05DRAFT_49106 [Hypoxylon sp. FL0543]